MLGIVMLVLSFHQAAVASDATQQLQSAVHRLTARLSSDEHEEGWRRYLLLNILETQSAKGEQADLMLLQTIHQRFASDADGLNHPIFADVRKALANQINSLANASVGDIRYAIANAGNEYRAVTISQMENYRDQLLVELESLKHFYRAELSSYKRAQAFYTLQLDELTEFLAGIEFELAPEFSVGKMNSIIADVKEKLDEVEKKIDALPFTDEEDSPTPDDDPDEDEELSLEPPSPDDAEDTVGDLEKEQKALEDRITELNAQRKAIAKKDLPRARLRVETYGKLGAYEDGFSEAAKDYGDPYFVSTRLAFMRFMRSYRYGTEDNLQEDFLKNLDTLAGAMEDFESTSSRESIAEVGAALAWLEDAGQAPRLVTAIRSRYSLPNFYLSISSNLINQVASQTVRETSRLNENIDGRLARGSITTVGHALVELQNDPNQIHASLRLLADVNTSTYLQQGKVKVYVDVNGQAEGRRSIFANVGGLYANDPQVAANMNSQFLGTNSNLDLVNRIASKQFYKGQQQADVGAAARVKKDALEQFATQTDEPIKNGKQAFAEAKQKARNTSNYLPELYAYSQTDKIVLVGKKSSKSTLAAPGLPAQVGTYSDVHIRIHDSMLSNYVDPIFAGRKFSADELKQELEGLLGTTPGAFKPAENEADVGEDEEATDEEEEEVEQFSITFADVRPIQFEFDDNSFAVVVSGKRFSQGDSRINEGMKIILRFRISREAGKIVLARDGKAEIEFLDPESKSAKAVAFRSFLDGQLNPKEGGDDQTKVDLPDDLIPFDKIEALKDSDVAKGLSLNQCRIEGGWFYLGWAYVPGRQDANSIYSMPLDLPAIWNEATIDQIESIYTPVGQPAAGNIVPLR